MSADLTLEELAREARVTPRAVRYYVERGLIPSPERKGKNTRYDRELVVRLRAIGELRLRGMQIDPIRKKLASMPHDELLKLAGAAIPAPAPAPPQDNAASGHQPPTGAAEQPPSLAQPAPEPMIGPYRPALAHASERWEHVTVCPGVVLMVRGEADAEAWRVAREIVRAFGGTKS